MEEMFSNSIPQNTSNAENLTEVYEAVRWTQLCMSVLSIIGSGSIVVFSAAQRLFQSRKVHPLLLLSGSDLLLAVSWLVGAVLFTPNLETHLVCYHLHTVEQILYMTSFFYTLHYVWNLYCDLSCQLDCSMNGYRAEVTSRVASPRLVAVLAGAVPWLLMSPVLIQANLIDCSTNCSQSYRCLLMQTGALYIQPRPDGQRRDCWLLHGYRDLVFLVAFLLTLVGITVVMVEARRVHRRLVTSGGFLGDRQWARLSALDRRMMLYLAVFIFCWAPALLVAVLRWTKPAALQGAVAGLLYITQAVTAGSQGGLNSLVYGWTRSHFRDARWRRSTLRNADTQTPLLCSQRRGPQGLGPWGPGAPAHTHSG